MRWGIALVALAGALAASGSAGVASSAACGPAGARTLAGDGSARVYVDGAVFGCARGGRTVRLGGSTSSCLMTDRIGPVALAGATAAYASERCGVDTGETTVIVRSLGSGHVWTRAPADDVLAAESYTSLGSIVVRSDGGAAWIAVTDSLGGHGRATEVWSSLHAAAHRLDAGSGIAPGSLRRRGRRISWRHDGRVRSALLG